MQFDFPGEMAKRTDEELIQILTIDRENYLPEALAAANEEFRKRNLDEEKVSQITRVISKQRDNENKRAAEPLDAGLKIAAFLLPMFLMFILSGYFKANGYDKKANSLARWTFYGFGLYFIIVIIIVATRP
jgi:hypothetical protein